LQIEENLILISNLAKSGKISYSQASSWTKQLVAFSHRVKDCQDMTLESDLNPFDLEYEADWWSKLERCKERLWNQYVGVHQDLKILLKNLDTFVFYHIKKESS